MDIDGETTLVMQRPAAKGPSSWARRSWGAFVRGFWAFVDWSHREPRLGDHLPPIPERPARVTTLVCEGGIAERERGERLLLEVLRAPPEYLHALADVAHWAMQLQGRGLAALDGAIVYLAVARTRPDKNGEIPIRWIEQKLETLPSYRLTQALGRLEAEGAIELLPAREGDVGPRVYDELRGYFCRVRLRRPL
ncbi:hypothetical protein [Polyangium aurulentum]|uniref:hypothetical protein n=1 Tax=Polyangium aurulentum TaxID=2567896 RepID=UPI0010AEA520|nr:hypothetical protein [Polyangium aurulentum]UQA57031.1 hypothetical protein E8A73_037930 [Polyangium aurulentum]